MANITLKGNAIHTNGELPKPGQTAPDFKLVDADLNERTLSDYKGKRKLISIVPSLDTSVCSLSTKKFNEQVKSHPEIIAIVVSADLPFAQKRICGAENIKNMVALSMLRSKDFAQDYGMLIIDGPLAGLAARGVLVIDEKDKVVYKELVPEITQEPNYEKALEALLK
jgi:thioredoxin-dependent peroxiredoxin